MGLLWIAPAPARAPLSRCDIPPQAGGEIFRALRFTLEREMSEGLIFSPLLEICAKRASLGIGAVERPRSACAGAIRGGGGPQDELCEGCTGPPGAQCGPGLRLRRRPTARRGAGCRRSKAAAVGSGCVRG